MNNSARLAVRLSMAWFVVAGWTLPARAQVPTGPPGALTLSLKLDHHSDPIAINDIDDRHAPLDPRSGRNLVYLRDEARASVRLHWLPRGEDELSVLARASGTIVATADALRLKTLIDQKAAVADGRRFDVDGRYVGFKGWGVAFEHRQGSAMAGGDGLGLGWQVSAQALKLTKLRVDEATGRVSAASSSSLGYLFDVNVHTVDDRTQWPYRQPFDTSGWGLLWGGGLKWCEPAWCAQARVEDLGRLRWNGLPQDDSSLSTDVLGYDEDGYLTYKRSLREGRLTQRRVTQTAPWSTTLSGQWRVQPRVTLGAAVQQLRDFGALPRIEADWQALPTLGLHADWRFHERRLSLSVGGRWQALQWKLGAGCDRLDSQARSQSLEAVLGWAWR